MSTLEEGALAAPEYAPPQDADPAEAPAPEDLEPDSNDGRADPVVIEVDEEEELEPKTLPVKRILIDERGKTGEYVQEGLKYFGKIQLYGILGKAVKIAMSGENAMRVDELMELSNPKKLIDRFMSQMPGADTAPDADEHSDIDMNDAAKMMAAFAEVVESSPELLMDAYCVILKIPMGHRKWAVEWGLPEMDDEMGVDILHTFIDQNWAVMEDFFGQELPRIFKRAAKARQRHKSAGDRSKP